MSFCICPELTSMALIKDHHNVFVKDCMVLFCLGDEAGGLLDRGDDDFVAFICAVKA